MHKISKSKLCDSWIWFWNSASLCLFLNSMIFFLPLCYVCPLVHTHRQTHIRAWQYCFYTYVRYCTVTYGILVYFYIIFAINNLPVPVLVLYIYSQPYCTCVLYYMYGTYNCTFYELQVSKFVEVRYGTGTVP